MAHLKNNVPCEKQKHIFVVWISTAIIAITLILIIGVFKDKNSDFASGIGKSPGWNSTHCTERMHEPFLCKFYK